MSTAHVRRGEAMLAVAACITLTIALIFGVMVRQVTTTSIPLARGVTISFPREVPYTKYDVPGSDAMVFVEGNRFQLINDLRKNVTVFISVMEAGEILGYHDLHSIAPGVHSFEFAEEDLVWVSFVEIDE